MSRVIVIVGASLALAGCASGGTGMSLFQFEPTPVSVQFQSEPAGAEAKTSAGQSCQTPCALAMAPDKDFSVTFSLAGYQPLTVPVQVAKAEPGSEVAVEPGLDPNPVAVELKVAPKTPAKRTPARKPATTASASKPAAARPAARPAAAPRQTAPSAAPPATDPWPPVSPQ